MNSTFEECPKHTMDPWEMEDILTSTIQGESAMRGLEVSDFLKTYQRMSAAPRARLGLQLTRCDGRPFFSDSFYEEHLSALKKKFMASKNESLTKEEFYCWVKKNIKNIKLNDEFFNKMFNLIDMDLDGVISWSELISYFETEMVEKYFLVNGYTPPLTEDFIKGPATEVENRHKGLITLVTYWPSITKERELEPNVGRYLTVSVDGKLDVYNLNMDTLFYADTDTGSLPGIKTSVVAGCILPDIKTLCLGSMERDIRFYDLSQEKVTLIYRIYNFETGISCMLYKFYKDPKKKSFIAVGDADGRVTAILFSTEHGGPFRKKYTTQTFQCVRWSNIRTGCDPEINVREFRQVHKIWVESMTYCEELDCLISTSNSQPVSVALIDVHERCVVVTFAVPMGVSCADILPPPPENSMLPFTGYHKEKLESDDKQVFKYWIVTGGLDAILRVWDINDTSSPRATMKGHLSRIKYLSVVRQRTDFPIIISYARTGRIYIWNGRTYEKMQMYEEGLQDLPQVQPIALYYNPDFQRLIIAGFKILTVKVGQYYDGNFTAGSTHLSEVTHVLYNTVYHVLITVSLGSAIARWNPVSGAKELVIANAHTTSLIHGKRVFGITTATFNQEQNLLATGAADGSIKLWDFYKGVVVRSMNISNGPVTQLIWLKSRIMAAGYGNTIRVWENTIKYDPNYKDLQVGSKAVITAVQFVRPSYLFVGTITGELLYCDAGSGLPIKRFMVQNPTKNLYLDVDYEAELKNEKNLVFEKEKYLKCGGVGKMSVYKIYVLEARPIDPKVGNVVVSLETGVLQFWSSHKDGGFVDSFYAVHRTFDRIMTMTSDKENKYLFTGTVLGYLKLWYLPDFATDKGKKPLLAALRLQFTFMVADRVIGAAKKAAKNERTPLLLNCYRAHGAAVVSIIYLDNCQVVITGGADKCVRYWTLIGQFLNGLGSNLSWISIDFSKPMKATELRIPTDLRRILSSTTLKVLTRDFRCIESGDEEPDIGDEANKRRINSRTTKRKAFGERLTMDNLGTYFEMPKIGEKHTIRPVPHCNDYFTQAFENIELEKTEKVLWIKPPKIIRPKRKRLHHAVLRNEKNRCKECREERNEQAEGIKLQHKRDITLEQGLKLKKASLKKKENENKVSVWKSYKKSCAPPIDTPYSIELLGKSDDEIIQAFGDMAKGVACEFGEFYLFGQKIPSGKNEMHKFIGSILKAKQIEDTPKNRQYIKNIITVMKRNMIIKEIEDMATLERDKRLDFDCFTLEEKKKEMEQRRRLWEVEEVYEQPSGTSKVEGIYSLIADCLYEKKFMEMSDDELLKILNDLAKPIEKSAMSRADTRHKNSSNLYDNGSLRKDGNAEKWLPPADGPIREFVRKLLDEDSELLKLPFDGFCDVVTDCVQQVIRNEPCPRCGIKTSQFRVRSLDIQSTKSGTQPASDKAKSRKRNPLLSTLKSFLIKADVAEMKEDDVVEKLGDFLKDIISKCSPLCKSCNSRNIEETYPLDKFDRNRTIKLLKAVQQTLRFSKPKEAKFEKRYSTFFKRSKVYLQRSKECEAMKLQHTFQEMKKLNIQKLNVKLMQLKNDVVKIKGFSENEKTKRSLLWKEIKVVESKIADEYKRKFEI